MNPGTLGVIDVLRGFMFAVAGVDEDTPVQEVTYGYPADKELCTIERGRNIVKRQLNKLSGVDVTKEPDYIEAQAKAMELIKEVPYAGN